MASYSLRGDRGVEYGYAGSMIRPAPNGGLALDVGPGRRARLAREAVKQGWRVTGVDLESCQYKDEAFTFVQDDLRRLSNKAGPFDLILNVSSLEHFGVPGRYGVSQFEPDADFQAMAFLRQRMTKDAQMVVTLPVGVGVVLAPFHRVYNKARLTALTMGFDVLDTHFWHKRDGVDTVWHETDLETATRTRPTLTPHHYYAVGGFVLRRKAG